MKDDWSNPKFVGDWDKKTGRNNPARAVHLGLLKKILVDNYEKDKYILDLGFGTGQFEEILFKEIENPQFICVDSSEVMISNAKSRLGENYSKMTVIKHDLNKIEDLQLINTPIKFALTFQVLHEIQRENRLKIFKFIYNHLEGNGTYLFMDKVKTDYQGLSKIYKSLWNWQDETAEQKANWDFDKYANSQVSKEDYPGTLADNLRDIASVGFKTACIHLQFDRAVIAGVK
ncbi:MAG TPA: class I SAM-dependent methyltransferase [Patescibacteria group bacterium]|jgi:ubiquinone/menaquinone biosynthesis C-methylase UbiE|nr:class I SAM-dependent methyltransferase [Patescibacteria group bacterium]